MDEKPVKLHFLNRPNEKMERTEFFEGMMQPNAPDEIALQIDRDKAGEGPEVGFSKDAVNEIAEQFRAFLLARCYGRYQGTGIMPKHVRATVTLDWNPSRDPVNDPNVGPFYQLGDKGLDVIDGELRSYTWRGES